jgi:catechol 2,3-dioxygenase-like lactoylglutathione lyase family enzyme
MDIKLSACFIPVDDHDKALAFYRDVLGLEVRNDVEFEGCAG